MIFTHGLSLATPDMFFFPVHACHISYARGLLATEYTHVQTAAVPVEVGTHHPVAIWQ